MNHCRFATKLLRRGITQHVHLTASGRVASTRLLSVMTKGEPTFVDVTETRAQGPSDGTKLSTKQPDDKVKVESSCGTVNEGDDGDDDDGMEQEEMFVNPHESFQHRVREWGGPRRGGRLLEPTRFGDWERKGRCTDF
jgi:Protein of unknown function (DUF1674)